MKLTGKKAIVTGANRSIGRAIALLFAQEGAEVILSYRSDPQGYGEGSALDPAIQDIPLGREGLPTDLASTALFLATDASSWMTGQILTVDGGHSLAL